MIIQKFFSFRIVAILALLLSGIIANAQNDECLKLIEKGLIKHEKEDYDAAVKLFTKAAEADPSAVEPLVNRAISYEVLERYEEAIADLYKALSMNSELSDIYYNLGFVYDEMKDTTNALKYYREAIEYDAYNADAYLNIAAIMRERGKIEDAVNILEKGIEKSGLDPLLNFSLGRCYYDLHNYEQAEIPLLNAFELIPENYGPSVLLYHTYKWLEDQLSSDEFLEKAKSLGATDEIIQSVQH